MATTGPIWACVRPETYRAVSLQTLLEYLPPRDHTLFGREESLRGAKVA